MALTQNQSLQLLQFLCMDRYLGLDGLSHDIAVMQFANDFECPAGIVADELSNHLELLSALRPVHKHGDEVVFALFSRRAIIFNLRQMISADLSPDCLFGDPIEISSRFHELNSNFATGPLLLNSVADHVAEAIFVLATGLENVVPIYSSDDQNLIVCVDTNIYSKSRLTTHSLFSFASFEDEKSL